MDINTLLEKMEQGETTVDDAEWLRQYLAMLGIKRICVVLDDMAEMVDTVAAMRAADESERW